MSAPGLNRLAWEINEINQSNGWDLITSKDWENPYKIPCSLALIHSEVSEALEGFRVGDKRNVAEELADILIRTLDLAGGLDINIEFEIEAKLEKNRSRGFRHGGKLV